MGLAIARGHELAEFAPYSEWCGWCGEMVGGVTLGNLKYELEKHWQEVHGRELREEEVRLREEETLG